MQIWKKPSSGFCQQCEKHTFVLNFSSSVGRSNPSGVHFTITLAKMFLVAGSSASAEERVHAVLQSPLCMVEGTTWPFWTLFPVLMKAYWLWGSQQGDPGHDLTWLAEAKLWGTLSSECVCSVIFDVWYLYISHLLQLDVFCVFWSPCTFLKTWTTWSRIWCGCSWKCNKLLLGENINNDSLKNLLLMCCFRCPQSQFTVRI